MLANLVKIELPIFRCGVRNLLRLLIAMFLLLLALSTAALTAEATGVNDERLIANDSSSIQSPQQSIPGKILVIPSGTKLRVALCSSVNSDTNQDGDDFTARTVEDESIDGQNAVPSGSSVQGKIIFPFELRQSIFSKTIALRFEKITVRNQQVSVDANVVAHGGMLRVWRDHEQFLVLTTFLTPGSKDSVYIGRRDNHFKPPRFAIMQVPKSKRHSNTKQISDFFSGPEIGTMVLPAQGKQKIDFRPGDQFTIELSKDLHVPFPFQSGS
jgi:hypothetical protein